MRKLFLLICILIEFSLIQFAEAKTFEICPVENFEILVPSNNQVIENKTEVKIDKPELISKLKIQIDSNPSNIIIDPKELKFGKHQLKAILYNNQNIKIEREINFIIKKPLREFISEIEDRDISRKLKIINNLKNLKLQSFEKLKNLKFQNTPFDKLLKIIYKRYYELLEEKIKNRFDEILKDNPQEKENINLAYNFNLEELEKNKVVISEIAWMGTKASSYDEWIELFNPNLVEINLLGWKLKVSDREIELSKTIKPQAYFVMERTDDNTISNLEADIIYTLKGGFSNSGEKLYLISNKGIIVDFIDCSNGWFAGENKEKRTMERIYWFEDGNNPLNWKTSEVSEDNSLYFDAGSFPILGTPGF